MSSDAHRGGAIDFDDLNWERKRYRAWRAYGQSKLANLLFTSELQRRLTAAGSPVKATAAHPGYAATNLQSHSGSRLMASPWSRSATACSPRTRPAARCRRSTRRSPTSPATASPARPASAGLRGAPKLVARSAAARERGVARRLWTVSETLTGVSFPESQIQGKTL